MKKFKLMQILPSLRSGGVEQGTIDVANKLAENNLHSLIISNGGQMIKYLNLKYVQHHNLPVHSKNFIKIPFTANKINKIIEKNNVNIMHIRSRAPAWLLPFIKKNKIKTVSTFHNVYGNQNFLKKIYNMGLSKTDYIVAISMYVKEELINLYNINSEKITVINRGVDINFYDAKIDEGLNSLNFFKKINLPNHKKVIFFPGRLTEWKGQLEFLKVINELKNKPYIFYFAGDTKNKNYTKKFIKQINQMNLNDCCSVLGHLNKDDLKLMYYYSDLIISAPLKPEGFGRTISETLAMKKLVLAYNYGGVKNQLDGIDNIYKIKPLDQDELKNKIKLILDSSNNVFFKIKENGRAHIIKNFSKENMLEKYINLYSSMF